MDDIIERKLQAKNGHAPQDIAHMLAVCREHGIVVASHDDDSRQKIHQIKS
jgi:alpha-D-ribose 1-methylphosphonate 5-triphosphate diphosphatase PhnM